MIDGAVRKMDCGQITDGAACVVLASEKAARAHAAKRGLKLEDIPRIKGWGHHSAPILLETKLQLSQGQPLLFSGRCAGAPRRISFPSTSTIATS